MCFIEINSIMTWVRYSMVSIGSVYALYGYKILVFVPILLDCELPDL